MTTDSDGNNRSTFLEGLTQPRDLIYWDGKIYWSDFDEATIESINIDGTNREVIHTDAFRVIDIEVDRQNARLYWVQNTGGIPSSGIFSSELDGSGETLVQELFSHGIAIDGEENFLYRTDFIRSSIFRVNLDDVTDEEELVDGSRIRSISFDKANDRIYYADNQGGDVLLSANLSDGFSETTLVKSLVNRPGSIEIDLSLIHI